MIVTNKKTGKLYWFCGEVTDATNGAGMLEKSLYQSLETGASYVREVVEFKQKFQMSDPDDMATVLSRQGTLNAPLLTMLIGTVARLDTLLGVTDSSRFNDAGEEEVPSSPEWIAYMADQQQFIASMADAGLFKPLVLKVQRQLYPPPKEDTPYLVYNEDQTFIEQMTMPQDVVDMFEEDDLKIYVKARLWCDGTMQVVHPVEEQPW